MGLISGLTKRAHALIDHTGITGVGGGGGGGGGGLTDLLTGNDSTFDTTVGGWAATGGSIARIADGYKIPGATASLQFTATDSGHYCEVAVAGTFALGKVYDALVWLTFESDVFASPLEQWEIALGVVGTDAKFSPPFQPNADTYYSNGNGTYVPFLIRWAPSANRTGVTLRVMRYNASGGTPPTIIVRVGLARVVEVVAGSLGLLVTESPFPSHDSKLYLGAEALAIGGYSTFLSSDGDKNTVSDSWGNSTIDLDIDRISFNTFGNGGVRMSVMGSAPSSPLEGDTYYDSTLHKFRVYDGTVWQNCW